MPGSPPDAAGPALACSQTVTAAAGPITGRALAAVVTDRELAVLWLSAAGALLGTTWTLVADRATVAQDAVPIAPGPFTQLWATANGDEILVAPETHLPRQP